MLWLGLLLESFFWGNVRQTACLKVGYPEFAARLICVETRPQRHHANWVSSSQGNERDKSTSQESQGLSHQLRMVQSKRQTTKATQSIQSLQVALLSITRNILKLPFCENLRLLQASK